MIQIEKIWLFETKVLDPFFFGTIDGITAKMKDERTIELLDIALCEYQLTGVVKGGYVKTMSFGGEDNGVLRTLGKQEYEHSLSFNLPLYSGRIIDEMTGRQFSCLCQRRNGTRFVVFAQFEAESFSIDNEALTRITLSTGKTSAIDYNVNSFNITTVRDTIDIAAVCASLDKFNRMGYDFFPTTNIPLGYGVESVEFVTAVVTWGKSIGANGYTIVWGTDGLSFPNTITISGGGTESFEITGLPIGATFYTKIKATGQFVDSLFSAVVSDTTDSIAPPQNFVLSNFGETTADANWDTIPESTGYEIVWGTDGITFANSQEVAGGTTDNVEITGLTSGVTIFAKILSHTSVGDSGFSNVDSGDTLIDNPLSGLVECFAAVKVLTEAQNSNGLLAFRIRRSSDNAEDNVLWSNNLFTSITLASLMEGGGTLGDFVGANDGFIRTWYRQDTYGTGDGSPPSFPTTLANNEFTTFASQPRLIDSGVLSVANGIATPEHGFDGALKASDTADSLGLFTNFPADNYLFMGVLKNLEISGTNPAMGVAVKFRTPALQNTLWRNNRTGFTRLWRGAATDVAVSERITTDMTIGTMEFIQTGELVSVWDNGTVGDQDISAPLASTGDPVFGLGGQGTYIYKGFIGFAAVFKSDEVANRVAIETKLADIFGITYPS